MPRTLLLLVLTVYLALKLSILVHLVHAYITHR